jgi:predicted dienelactone hydrolase
MKTLRFSLLLAVASLSPSAFSCLAGDTSSYPPAAVSNAVDTVKYDWQDAKRDRAVPVKIYYPKTGSGPFPIIIFSHGLGGSRDGYSYLGNYWASHGYVSVHLQHIGSDTSVFQNASGGELHQTLVRAAADPGNITNRPLDVSFAIDQMIKLNGEESPFKGRLDTNRIGMAGHSFGAFTTLAIAGQLFISPLGREASWPDPRVKAAIPMSASVPRNKKTLDEAYSKIKIPCFHMTGTEDDSPIGDTKAEDRRIPFDHSKGSDQYLVTFKDGDHMIFSGRLAERPDRQKDSEFQKSICAGSLAFWDACLKGDEKAKSWLAGTGFESDLKDDGKFEKKLLAR